jgi:hypothetical protein
MNAIQQQCGESHVLNILHTKLPNSRMQVVSPIKDDELHNIFRRKNV